jgi:glycosyltransferase involved in cell wall biosynthesis
VTPLVSVIIPTANRPQFLPRAVESALDGMSVGSVEVIVVPNGGDKTWSRSLSRFAKQPQVRIEPIATAHACAARNHGLSLAKGSLVRFLDDDDYLFAPAAARQYEAMETKSWDVAMGSIRGVSASGQEMALHEPIESTDFCEAVSTSGALYLPHAFVYRKQRLTKLQWREGLANRQDFFWLMDLCISGEVAWERTREVVGAWRHHSSERITASHSGQIFFQRQAEGLIELFDELSKQARLTEGRRTAIAEGLWGCVHSAFPNHARYWAEIGRRANAIQPESRPKQPLYRWPLVNACDPLLLQWLLWPKRRWDIYRRATEAQEAERSAKNV